MNSMDSAKGTFNGKEFIDGKYIKSNTQSSTRINLTTTRTISPEDSEDLSFENIAEIIQFSNEAGRRDEYAIVGNAAIWKGAWKASTPTDLSDANSNSNSDPCGGTDSDNYPDGLPEGRNYDNNKNNATSDTTSWTYDTDTTEVILLSPPTGLSQSELKEIEAKQE